MTRYGRSFAERNRVLLAVVVLAVMAIAFYGAMNMTSLPVLGAGPQHQAIFAEASGLRAGDEVRVAGVRVGKVTSVRLKDKAVLVSFQAKGVRLTSATTASIKVKTMLGQKFVAIDPLGTGDLKGPIPLSRTTTPYDVNAAVSDLTSTLGEIDTAQMEESFQALTAAFKNTPDSVQKMVGGLTDLSRTISGRDSQLAGLMEATKEISATLAGRNDELAKLINDGSSLLGELETRRDAIHAMWAGSRDLGLQLQGLVKDNDATLKPALAKLDKVTELLNKNQQKLSATLERLGPYYRVLGATMGNGRWVDAYMCGLFMADGTPQLDNSVVRDCNPGGAQ